MVSCRLQDAVEARRRHRTGKATAGSTVDSREWATTCSRQLAAARRQSRRQLLSSAGLPSRRFAPTRPLRMRASPCAPAQGIQQAHAHSCMISTTHYQEDLRYRPARRDAVGDEEEGHHAAAYGRSRELRAREAPTYHMLSAARSTACRSRAAPPSWRRLRPPGGRSALAHSRHCDRPRIGGNLHGLKPYFPHRSPAPKPAAVTTKTDASRTSRDFAKAS